MTLFSYDKHILWTIYFGITRRKTRRLMGDMIQTGKDPGTIFSPAGDTSKTKSTTGHLNVRTIEGNFKIRRNSFSPRVVDSWNALPNDVELAPFKTRPDDLPTTLQSGATLTRRVPHTLRVIVT